MPTVTKVEPVILKLWPATEMGEVWQGSVQHFVGNDWDFHPGCMGTKFKINGKWTDVGDGWQGAHDLAATIAERSGAKLVVRNYKTTWRG